MCNPQEKANQIHAKLVRAQSKRAGCTTEDMEKAFSALPPTAGSNDDNAPRRKVPERSFSTDSYEDYHRKVFEKH